MGALTRDDIVARVRQAASATTSDDATIVDLLEEVLDEFADLTSINTTTYSYVLTANDGEYTLSSIISGFLRFKSVRLLATTGDRAQPLAVVDDLSELAELRARDTQAAVPSRYAILGLDTLVLYPTPDAAHTLLGEVVLRVTAPSGGSSVPGVPQEYHPALVAGTIAAYLRWDRQSDADWGPFRQEFELGVDRCRRAMKRVHGVQRKAAQPSSSLRSAGGYPVNLADT